MLSNHLKNDPALHVLTGPVNSGKFLIIKKLTNQLKNQYVSLTDINLREISFNSVDTFVDTLEDANKSWLDQFKEVAMHFKMLRPTGNAIRGSVNTSHKMTQSSTFKIPEKTTTLDILAQKENFCLHYR